MREVTVAATQMACTNNLDENITCAEKFTRGVANAGANIILIKELFEGLYFFKMNCRSIFLRNRETAQASS